MCIYCNLTKIYWIFAHFSTEISSAPPGNTAEVTSQEEVEGDWCGEIVVVPFCALLVIYMVILSV